MNTFLKGKNNDKMHSYDIANHAIFQEHGTAYQGNTLQTNDMYKYFGKSAV